MMLLFIVRYDWTTNHIFDVYIQNPYGGMQCISPGQAPNSHWLELRCNQPPRTLYIDAIKRWNFPHGNGLKPHKSKNLKVKGFRLNIELRKSSTYPATTSHDDKNPPIPVDMARHLTARLSSAPDN
ncbi:hypothetical protein [Pseudomonas lini]